MANLSRSQLTGLAQSVGFTGPDVAIAVAVALAESGGNPGAHNSTPPDDSYGLWQINMLGSLGPPRRKKFGISSNTDLFRPAINAKAAKIIFNESGWKAWTTYTGGKYKQFLTENPVLPTGPIVDTPGKVGTPEEVAESTEDTSIGGMIKGAVDSVGQNLFKATTNLTAIIVAVVIIVLGVVLLARDVIPYGKLLKSAKASGGAFGGRGTGGTVLPK